MPGTETQEEPQCEGCHVWGQPHIVAKPAWWYESIDESSSSSGDCFIQDHHVELLAFSEESLVVSQMAREEEGEEQREPGGPLTESDLSSASYTTAMTPPEVENHFTVFVRLPFNRGDFVDPPPVNWSAAKERALWDILSRQTNNQIDWRALAERFEVTQPFLLQKAAWLYERQLSQVRAQMRRVGNRNSATPSPTPGSLSGSMVGDHAMRRAGSGGSRVPSRLSTQQVGSPVTGGGDSTPETPVKSRTPLPLRTAPTAAAAGVAQQARNVSGTSRPLSRQSSRDVDAPAPASHSRRGSIQHQLARSPAQTRNPQPESSDSEEEMTQSRITARRPNPSSLHRRALSYRGNAMQAQRGPATSPDDRAPIHRSPVGEDEDEDDEDDEPSFLPFANPPTESKPRPSSSSQQQDPSATLRGALRPTMQRRTTSERVVSSPTVVEPPTPVQARDVTSSTSSLSSPTQATGPATTSRGDVQPLASHLPQQSQAAVPRLGTPLSPSHRALLNNSNQPSATASPRRGPSSDSASPSMGSSFSDLDDTSVTQSALEEALLSGMGNTTMTNLGGFGGRVTSGIGQALRSRYFDARGDGQGRNGGQGATSER